MAVAMKCDICKKFYERYNENFSPITPNVFAFGNKAFSHNPRFGKINDCCPDCMAKIKNFVAELKTESEKIPEEEIPEDNPEIDDMEGEEDAD